MQHGSQRALGSARSQLKRSAGAFPGRCSLPKGGRFTPTQGQALPSVFHKITDRRFPNVRERKAEYRANLTQIKAMTCRPRNVSETTQMM